MTESKLSNGYPGGDDRPPSRPNSESGCYASFRGVIDFCENHDFRDTKIFHAPPEGVLVWCGNVQFRVALSKISLCGRFLPACMFFTDIQSTWAPVFLHCFGEKYIIRRTCTRILRCERKKDINTDDFAPPTTKRMSHASVNQQIEGAALPSQSRWSEDHFELDAAALLAVGESIAAFFPRCFPQTGIACTCVFCHSNTNSTINSTASNQGLRMPPPSRYSRRIRVGSVLPKGPSVPSDLLSPACNGPQDA